MYNFFEQCVVNDFSENHIAKKYDDGFVFTRLGKGVMQQVTSVRVDLDQFEPSSENRRILKKGETFALVMESLPLPEYSWEIGKLAKDFYTAKFGDNVMSANKAKEMFTDSARSNMNSVLIYNHSAKPVGYCLAVITQDFVHYSYPFYDLSIEEKSLGMIMMTKAVQWAKGAGKKYIYLGSDSKYKHQFKGLEVFNGTSWEKDT